MRTIFLFFFVFSITNISSSLTEFGNEFISPIAHNLILFLFNRLNSFFKELTSSFISKLTSFFGRFQFSVEKAKSVRNFIFFLAASSTISLTVSAPRVCPANLSFPTFFAQRPLPSIIMAICLGILFIYSLQ